MTATSRMYDAVNIDALPRLAQMVAGYVDGRDTAGHADRLRARFPHALLVRITVTGNTLDAHVADVEAGDLTPEDGASWARDKIAARQHPTLYCSASNWPAVRAELLRQHVIGRVRNRHRVSFWIADYDNNPTIPRGAVAKQYATGTYDTSAVRTSWPGVIPAELSPAAARAAHRLTRHLSRRRTPLTTIARADLLAADNQIARALKL